MPANIEYNNMFLSDYMSVKYRHDSKTIDTRFFDIYVRYVHEKDKTPYINFPTNFLYNSHFNIFSLMDVFVPKILPKLSNIVLDAVEKQPIGFICSSVDEPALTIKSKNGMSEINVYKATSQNTSQDLYIKFNCNVNNIFCEFWSSNGKIHKENGPAFKEYKKFKSKFFLQEEVYYMNNVIYREDGPSTIIYNEHNQVISEKWTDKQGNLNRENGPAIIYYEEEDGLVRYDMWKHGAYVNTVFYNKDTDSIQGNFIYKDTRKK